MKLERDLDVARWLESVHYSHGLFQWDRGNSTKNRKHGVRNEDVEELFLSPFVLGGRIIEPYHPENRWILFGQSLAGRKLSLIFTIRDDKIRAVSCRSMRKEEKRIYETTLKR